MLLATLPEELQYLLLVSFSLQSFQHNVFLLNESGMISEDI